MNFRKIMEADLKARTGADFAAVKKHGPPITHCVEGATPYFENVEGILLFNEGTAKELWVKFDNHHYSPTPEEIEYLSTHYADGTAIFDTSKPNIANKPTGEWKMSITDMVRDNAKVCFEYFRDDQLWYKTEVGGFLFPVPVADIGTATFLKADKAMLFMRYIRKYQEAIAQEGNSND